MMTELERLRGVGSETADTLRKDGFDTAEEVLDASTEDLLSIDGIGRGLVMNMEITDERNLKRIRVPRDWRKTLKEAVEGTDYTLSDALRAVLPEDVDENRMEIPEDEYVAVHVEEDVHGRVTSLAGKNVTSLDVLEKYLGDVSSEELQDRLDNQHSATNDENNE